jgi:hypothetical protein
MPIKFIDKYKVGFQVIVKAQEGYLLGGSTVDSGPVFDTFFDALGYMNDVIDANVNAYRKVKLGMVMPFRGMVSTGVFVPE